MRDSLISLINRLGELQETRRKIVFPNARMLVLVFFSAAMIFTMSGCGTISGTIRSPGPVSPDGRVNAGAAKVDITPPPGYPMGGHSIAGKTSRGHWLRLYARTIFLQDPLGKKLVLVSADLWSIPAGLADRVAEEVNSADDTREAEGHQKGGICSIERESLIIAATHTHQSPGNFSSSVTYNSFASPEPGFDPNLLEFLTHRIAASIRQACKERRPAEITYSSSRMRSAPFARNRSFEAFMANGAVAEEILKENRDLPVGEISPEYPFPDSYHAIDPTLRVLRVQSADPQKSIIAVAAFVSVHATSLSHDAEVYNSDLLGYAALSLEKGLIRRATGSGGDVPLHYPVVAIFNGAEGDISPSWKTQDRRDTARLGRDLATYIDNLIETMNAQLHPLDITSIDSSFKEFALPGACCKPNKEYCADKDALVGVPALGGAEDGRTVFYYCGWHEGITARESDGWQGNKRPAFSLSDIAFPCSHLLQLLPTRLVNAIFSAPRVIPIGVYKLGPMPIVLATLPGEFTTTMGRNIVQSIQEAVGQESEIILIGLANEYLSYFTTDKEYLTQSYEGASTLYGVWSGRVVGCVLKDLAENMKSSPSKFSYPHEFMYKPGPKRYFSIHNLKEVPYMGSLGLEAVVLDKDTGRSNQEVAPSFCWSERIMDLVGDTSGGRSLRDDLTGVSRVTPLVRIMTPDNSLIQGDDGVNFVTVVLNHDESNACWCSFLLEQEARQFKFVVDTTDNNHHESPPCRSGADGFNRNCLLQQAIKSCAQGEVGGTIP